VWENGTIAFLTNLVRFDLPLDAGARYELRDDHGAVIMTVPSGGVSLEVENKDRNDADEVAEYLSTGRLVEFALLGLPLDPSALPIPMLNATPEEFKKLTKKAAEKLVKILEMKATGLEGGGFSEKPLCPSLQCDGPQR
jgi:hypothetical protein